MIGLQERGAKPADSVVTPGPWIARDAAGAETAIALDRLAAKVERLEQREEALKAQVAELMEHAAQAGRLQALAQSLRNSRDYKLDEVLRMVKDVRGRVDAIEGPRAVFSGLTYKTFAAVDRKLVELEAARASRSLGRQPVTWLMTVLIAMLATASAATGIF